MNVQKQVGWGTRNLTNFAPSLVTTYQVQPTSSVNASECWTATAKAIAISKGRPPAPPSFAHRALFDICTVHLSVLYCSQCKLQTAQKREAVICWESFFACLTYERPGREVLLHRMWRHHTGVCHVYYVIRPVTKECTVNISSNLGAGNTCQVLIKIGYCWIQPSGLTLVSLFRRFISGLVAPQCACNQIVDSEMTQHWLQSQKAISEILQMLTPLCKAESLTNWHVQQVQKNPF